MFKRLILTVSLALAALTGTVHATHAQTAQNAWYLCKIRYTQDFTAYSAYRCWTVPMPRHHERVTGWRINRVMLSSRLMQTVRYPVFAQPKRVVVRPIVVQHAVRPAPSGPVRYFSVSAYSWGCGASGAMADGRMPYPGAVAAGPDYPFGTVLSIPGFGRTVVEDRGGAIGDGNIDVFVNSCSQAMAWGRQYLPVQVSY